MFDLFIRIPKNHLVQTGKMGRLLSGQLHFDNIAFEEVVGNCEHFTYNFLRRMGEKKSDFFESEELIIFQVGNVFTNAKFQTESKEDPQICSAARLAGLFQKYAEGFIDRVKGIFIIALYLKKRNEFLIFNGRYSLLDIYYASDKDSLLISTSLYTIRQNMGEKPQLDEVSIIQHAIFDYPLGNRRTHFKGIFPLPSASYLNIKDYTFEVHRYYNIDSHLDVSDRKSWDETYQYSPKIFNATLDLMAQLSSNLVAAITGGYDSRTVLSRLSKLQNSTQFYTWGMSSSWEIKIAKEVTAALGLNYSPIQLTEEFEENYEFFAHQIVNLSDGRATIRRANHSFGYSKLNSFSKVNLTGLFGSELLRPSNSVGHIYNQEFVDVFTSDNKRQALHKVIENAKSYLLPNFLNSYLDQFIEESLAYFTEYETFSESYQNLYKFTLLEGFRKYFVHEIHGCRAYLDVLSPYIDDDFVEFILQSPVPLLDRHAFKRDVKSLRLGQLFYIPILAQNDKRLLAIRTSRLYSPKDISSKFYPLSIIPGYAKAYYIKKIKNINDTFDSPRWTKNLMKQNSKIYQSNPFFHFAEVLTGADKESTLYSLLYWLGNDNYD